MAFNKLTTEQLQALNKNTLGDFFGIEYTEIGDDYLKAKMPVSPRTVQPLRMLHGGASVAFAETLGSIAGVMSLPDPSKQTVLGLEINANHIRSAKEGSWVYGECRPLHLGRSTMVFETKITNEQDKLLCVSRLTVAIVDIKA
jgi:1,4-dihydroxy-2-naphthoyl-CoA hydrolase